MKPLRAHISWTVFVRADGDFVAQEPVDEDLVGGRERIDEEIPAFTNRVREGNAVLVLGAGLIHIRDGHAGNSARDGVI